MATLGKNEVSESRGHFDNLFNGIIRQQTAIGEIENAQRLVGLVGRELEEGIVRNEVAVRETDLTKLLQVGEKRGDGGICDLVTSMEIDFKKMRAVFGE